MTDLASQARTLRDLHKPGDPVVLPNAWDAATAKQVEEAGFPAVASTSSGVAHALGYEDGQDTPPQEMFAAVARIAAAVDVPVTADLEGGYGLPAGELVERMLDAGVVGLNFEDTDHPAGDKSLVQPQRQAERIAELRQAANDAGVDIVINARTDAYVRQHEDPLSESLERGRLYLDAGADCIFPITVKDEGDIQQMAQDMGAPINVLLIPGVPEIPRLKELGVGRVSVGGGLAVAALRSHAKRLESLKAGKNYW
jgi:2-methylisocitrate lyase-like PEP mutase family enzyme